MKQTKIVATVICVALTIGSDLIAADEEPKGIVVDQAKLREAAKVAFEQRRVGLLEVLSSSGRVGIRSRTPIDVTFRPDGGPAYSFIASSENDIPEGF